ncbi:kasugamycin N-acetyltransferase AAC(2')-IIb [Cohnella nanjingensis]|uniref:Kasugamycin N-acetyltransferase AAC(2')-IIb n=1 Tax=Cohnella nanjingensis TaxID=1387779 RepID=A0A7X0RLD3_9BACL|nr:kasugamycin N-acetyltransferase AAC(2')-IIb [Cohnella nanjingensis]MBB6669486.1 kasugamycin N-acetyltransferase AAC(2')-IIb [Cohnella nanjingensis]
MEMHAEALFTHDRNKRLLTINEPWPGELPAPRFFLGRSMDGAALCRCRHDVPETLVEQLETLCADEPAIQDFQSKPRHLDAYMNLLQSERYTMGPCYLIPEAITPTMDVVSITRANITEWIGDGFEWLLSEIDFAQPCIAVVQDGKAVSICRSVRITSIAHEAGLETLEAYRGRGYAAAAVAGWARGIRQFGGIPLYSTLSENLSSRRVASKSGLVFYGVNFTIV